MHILQPGLRLYKNYLSLKQQKELVQIVYEILPNAPFFKAVSPRKKSLGTLMTNMGEYGWYSDSYDGYRYIKRHPIINKKWPAIPREIMRIWNDLANYKISPQCCLINYYDKENKSLGMHKDHDEKDFNAPVVSISLGDDCRFRYSTNTKKLSPSKSVILNSGAVLVMGGESRLVYHAVDKVFFGSNTLLNRYFDHGRLNLTLRVVS